MRIHRAALFSTVSPYLHETKIPTYHFQDSLPKLPVPKLEDTLKKYEYFSKPMVTPEEHQKTQAAVQEFAANEGAALQEQLVELDKKEYTSFYNKMWFDMYLESRDPLPLNYNPQLTFNDEKIASKNDQALRTANLLVSSARFYRTLLDEKLEPDLFHTQPAKSKTSRFETLCKWTPKPFAFYTSYLHGCYPLDMSQYQNLFSSTRIPKSGKDELKKFSPQESKHVVIQRGGAFYTMQILDDNLNIASHDVLEKGIRAILADSERPKQDPVGVLTTMERDEWASARAKLEQNAVNKASLEAIDSALFAVCLDDAKPETYPEVSSVMLHGDARNRWFDKSFQLIVAANGKACVNFEHAWGDGVAVLRYFNEVYNDSTALPEVSLTTTDIPAVSDAPTGQLGVPTALSFELDAEIKDVMGKAGSKMDQVFKTLELGTFETEAFGKNSLKKYGLGADGFMQMGFQLAHQRLKGYTPATYESASTAAFKHGRTETIRSATVEAQAFAQGFCDDSLSNEAKGELLKTAIKQHGSITKDALMGKGMDRHLFALRVLAQRKGGELPSIYTDKSYQVLNNIILSTSTLSSEALFAGGFGPVNKDCYALAYGIADDGARTAVASYQLGSDAFAHELEKAYKDMLAVFD